MRAFNISTFKTSIDSNGYLPTNKFEVFITPPPILSNAAINNIGTPELVNNIVRDLCYRIDTVRIPGVTLLTADNAPYGVGPTQKQPVNAQYSETSFSMLSDGYGNIWQFWHNWLRAVFEFTGTSASRVNTANKVPTYTSNYKHDYSTTMQIVMYDMFGNAIQKINLFEVFPVAMRETPMSWADNGNLLKININLSYSEYNIEGSDIQDRLNKQQLNLINATPAGATTITP